MQIDFCIHLQCLMFSQPIRKRGAQNYDLQKQVRPNGHTRFIKNFSQHVAYGREFDASPGGRQSLTKILVFVLNTQ